MFPSRGDLHVAPFQDEALYMEQINKVNFWYQDYFHGVNLSSLRDAAMKEYFRQPIVSSFKVFRRICRPPRFILSTAPYYCKRLSNTKSPIFWAFFCIDS